MNIKFLKHILINIPTYPPTNPLTHMQASDLDNYNKLSLWLSLKTETFKVSVLVTMMYVFAYLTSSFTSTSNTTSWDYF